MHAATAQANGRFPQSINVRVQPGNDQVILLAVTFGLLISRDGGATFEWVCEDAIGYGGRYDPDYAISPGGDLFATTWEGLRVSRDSGCSWINAPSLVGHWVEDVEVGPQSEVWAVTASTNLPNDVFLSTDNGETFTAAGLQRDALYWKSLRVAPSSSQRVYVTGYKVAQIQDDGGLSGPTAFAYRSIDGGQSWQELPLTGVELGPQSWFLLLAVAPDNPDVVFARSVGVNDPSGDALYRSTDGGLSFTRVLDTTDSISAFVIRKNGAIIAGTQIDGVYTSVDGGDTWTRAELPQMKCMAENNAGELLACGANWEPDFFALGRSSDGTTWQEVFRFSEMQSAYRCPAGTVQFDECEALRWPAVCEQFACSQADAGPSTPDAGSNNNDGNGGGCCDASPQPGAGHLLLAALVMLLIRSRRARARARA